MAEAIVSYGYPAVIDEYGEVLSGAIDSKIGAQYWPALRLGRYSVLGADDWKVTSQVGPDRGIRVNAGTLVGDAVMDVLPRYDTFSLPAVDNGSQWFLVVCRRSWSDPAVSRIMWHPGPIGTARPTELPPARKNEPGAEADQPLAYCRVDAGSTTIREIIDLRIVGGVQAAERLALEYLKFPGETMKVGDTRWTYEHLGSGNWDWRPEPKVISHEGVTSIIRADMTHYQDGYPGPGSGSREIASVTIPDPGFPYKMQVTATLQLLELGGSRWDLDLIWLDTVIGLVLGQPFTAANGQRHVNGLGLTTMRGPSKVSLRVRRIGNSTGGFQVTNIARFFRVWVVPA